MVDIEASTRTVEQLKEWYNSCGLDHGGRCAALEQVINESESKVREQWIRMGWALKTIRDDSLYTDSHESFADFVEQKLGYKKSWAYEVIDASEVAKVVPIKAVSQARVLAQMEPDEQKEVWNRAVEISDGEVTAKAIKQAAEPQQAEPEVQHSEPDPAPASALDSDEVRAIMQLNADLRSELKNICECAEKGVLKGEGGHWFDFDQFKSSLQNAARVLKMAMPVADCPYCGGKGCEACNFKGWLPKGVYDSLPASVKE